MPDCPILVTGAAGFIGSHFTESLLRDGMSVVGVDNFCDFYEPSIKRGNVKAIHATEADCGASFKLVDADIRERDVMLRTFEEHQPKAVVHLAAMAGVRPSIERPEYYTAVNLDGTVNLLDAAVANGCEKFVFASSSSVYGNNEKVPFAEEDRVDLPISPYAATKKAGELICHTYWHIHQLPVVCLRFFTVFGPRQRPDLAINKFLRLIRDGKEIPMFGDGSTSRDYTFIADIVAGVRASLDHCSKDVGYRVYNLGGSSPITLSDMIATIADVVGKPANIKQLPMQPGDVNRTWADLARSKAELGYEPSTSFKDGVAKQWAWLQSIER